MDKKQLFDDWAPRDGYVWTKFAKPALFVHTDSVSGRQVYEAEIPWDIRKFRGGGTAIIVDLPGVSGVETGLGLAQSGFRPVPLYNGIHEVKNGGLRDAVDNTAIINALKTGVNALKYTDMHTNAPPAFLLDADRDTPILDAEDVYDNRWNVDLDDMPDAAYMKEHGITRVLVWTDSALQNDLNHIINNYLSADIEVVTYSNRLLSTVERKMIDDTPEKPKISHEIKEAVRKFENARFSLLLVLILMGINLFGMFLVNEEPLLWTAPSIMWLTYLWVPEIVGDVIALAMFAVYAWLYLASSHKRELLRVGCTVFGIDVAVFYVYALYYGLVSFTGYSFMYGLVVFVPPIVLLSLLFIGVGEYSKIKNMRDDEYLAVIDHIDYPDPNDGNGGVNTMIGPRRRFFRPFRGANYRGFGGYGGTGRGGYGGGGYRGFGG